MMELNTIKHDILSYSNIGLKVTKLGENSFP